MVGENNKTVVGCCHERGNLHANEHRTEAETKSDIQVENLINVAEFKANFMGELYYY